MAKRKPGTDARWTEKDIQLLQDLVRQNMPTRLIALKLKRTEYAIRAKAALENISLKPGDPDSADKAD